MPRNLIVLCDGTANQVEADRSNVLRMYGCLERTADQIVFYDPGVGTFGVRGPFTKLRSGWATIKGLALGAGIDDNVFEAYRFLVENYRQDDQIFFFGFSRGAYTVRMLAGFIRVFGLIRTEQLQMLEYAWRAYLRAHGETPFDEAHHYEKILVPRKPRIRFLGVWDTVASVFEQSPSGFWLQRRQRPYTNRNDRVEIVRHALAIDERRSMFQPSLWAKGQLFDYPDSSGTGYMQKPQDAKEIWFAGCHSDVGGGYREEESGLAKIAMKWMIEEATLAGALIDHGAVDKIVLGNTTEAGSKKYAKPNVATPPHNSMNWAWWLVECLPRTVTALTSKAVLRLGRYYIPLADRRKIPNGATIHASVREKLTSPEVPTYAPPNLPKSWIWSDDIPGPP